MKSVNYVKEANFHGSIIYPKPIPKEYEHISFKKVWEELIDIDTLLYLILVMESSRKLAQKMGNVEFFEKLTLMVKIALKRLESN